MSETSGTISNAPTFELQGSQKKKIRRKGMRIFFFFFGTPSRLFAQKIFEEIILENFPSKENEIVKSKRHRVPYRINPRRNTPRHILIKLTKAKHKERILKAEREKQQVTYKGNPICLTADLSAGTL